MHKIKFLFDQLIDKNVQLQDKGRRARYHARSHARRALHRPSSQTTGEHNWGYLGSRATYYQLNLAYIYPDS